MTLDVRHLVCKVVAMRLWRNGYLIPLVEAAEQGRLALEHCDLSSVEEIEKEWEKRCRNK
jgi:hypothetical protein